MNEIDRAPMTPGGQDRRDRMLEELLASMAGIHRARRRRRRIAAGVAVLALGLGATWLAALPVGRRPPTIPEPAPFAARPSQGGPAGTAARTRPSAIEIVQTDVTLVEARRAQPTGLVERIGDDGLLALLEAVDRPAGLVRMEGRVWLTSAVADPLPDGTARPGSG